MGTVTKGFDARLANRPFLVFFTFGHSGAQSWAPECPKVKKLKTVG